MSTIGKRIRELRQARNLTASELAKKLGTSHTAISHWESGKHEPNRKNLEALASALGVVQEYLTDGRPGPTGSNVFPAPGPRGLVPLISWAKAQELAQAGPIEFSEAVEAESFLPCPVTCGPRTFALRVVGDAMSSPYGKTYPDGCLIFVDPDQSHIVTDGDRVVARMDDTATLVFKVFTFDAGSRLLRSINPAFPTISKPFTIVGKVLGQFSE